MADSERPELPAVLARMWGREPTPRRGPRPSLDLDRITRAAIEIADADGLPAVSMNTVASKLGVAPMSLYRYVGSKDELLLALLDAASGEPPPLDGASRREYLARWTKANTDVFVARPWLLSIARSGPPLGPRGLLWLEHLLGALDDTPLDDNEKILIGTTLNGYALTQASLITALEQSPTTTNPSSAAAYGELVAELVDEQTYPRLARLSRDRVFAGGDGPWVDEADFWSGLDLLLDGVEALIARRRGEDTRR
ncbi:TetR/AcrR family transcriptional regulator [Saccharomonospora sp. NB11]|uniref:TetR/AcrR family transcriptional regulator n=1 Tax=Saccharomonospora sp. NB11 TaxID=1642298 RepID=UPI0018D05B5A|nr:TetR/AcrR family transcriptional regulator [Saccharomonospora sp. NB11]